MPSYNSNSLEDTKKIAKYFSEFIKPGDVVLLNGDLGAGKTTFVNFLSKALNFKDQIVSPTFNIVLQYKNDDGLLINHFDLYRLNYEEELEDIAFYEILENGGITFIEWSDKFPNAMPINSISLNINLLSANTRTFSW